MDTSIESAAKVFEEVEKIRKGFEAKLSHLIRRRQCLDCGKDFMPKSYEPCPNCTSSNTKLLKRKRRCLDCGHVWQPSVLGVCPWCGSSSSQLNPKDDPYIREIAIPKLKQDEEFYEEQLKKLVENHPAWQWAKKVKGAGMTSIGRLIGKTDITRVNTGSEMWAHCGWALEPDGSRQRKRAGTKITYDPQLQSNCVMLGESLMKQKHTYYQYYLKQKAIHSALPPRHCHNRAFRHMIKLFVSHFWQTWREAEGLSAPEPYAFGIMNHPDGHLISPWEMVD